MQYQLDSLVNCSLADGVERNKSPAHSRVFLSRNVARQRDLPSLSRSTNASAKVTAEQSNILVIRKFRQSELHSILSLNFHTFQPLASQPP